jgi:PRTRC genetic system ThiF family protein
MKNIHAIPPYFLNSTHPITICLIGAGGTGSLMATRLARLDYALRQSGRTGLAVDVFDDDIVEEHNVGRQGFCPYDVGDNKAINVVTKVNRGFGCTFRANAQKFNIEQADSKYSTTYNIYITATDNAQFRLDFQPFFKNQKTPNCDNGYGYAFYWMDLGNAKNTGQCILGSNTIKQPLADNVVPVLPTIIDRYPNINTVENQHRQGNSCSYASKLQEQDLCINDCLSAQAHALLWKMFTVGVIHQGGFFLNLDNFNSNPINL